MKYVCIKDFFFPGTNSRSFVKGKIYVGSAIVYGAEFVNEGGVSHRIHGKLFDKYFIKIVESKITKHNKASQGSEDSTQFSAFVNTE